MVILSDIQHPTTPACRLIIYQDARDMVTLSIVSDLQHYDSQLAEIGDIKWFSNANKLAQFAGISPLHLSSSGKGKNKSAGTDLYFQTINQYYLWYVKNGTEYRMPVVENAGENV